MVSNGFINHDPLVELCPLINAANIDLKCFDEATYKKLTGGRLSTVLETLLTLKQQNVWLEITFLLIPEFNDDLEKIKKMCEWLVRNGFDDTPLHISRFFPAYKLSHLPPTPAELLLYAREIAKNSGIRYAYIGNVSHSESENTYCPQCGNLLIERKGFSVTKNHIKDGRCSYCNRQIAGTWG
jgi:pyruvate formate lyase activating enzyme